MNINTMTNTEAAYIAGMIDGEGSIYGNTLKITQAERGVAALWKIKEIIGAGGVSVHRPAVGNWQTVYRYQLQSSTLVRELFKQVAPYMIIKKEKALSF